MILSGSEKDVRGSQTLLCSPRSGSGCAVGLEALEKLEALERLAPPPPQKTKIQNIHPYEET